MGMMSTLGAALSGLRVTQAGIDVVAQNVSNADSVGYTRRRLNAVQQVVGGQTTGVTNAGIERILDRILQRQLRLETAGGAYTDVKARYHTTLDQLYGGPGGTGALDTNFNDLTKQLQALITDPSSYSTRSAVLEKAQTLATRINSISNSIQGLRNDAEAALAASVSRANDLLTSITDVNAKIVGTGTERPSAALLDERDRMINELSRLIDVKVTENANGSVSIATTGGLTLFDGNSALKLSFDQRANIGAGALYDTDATKRGVGTITAVDQSGRSIDLLATGMIRSGEIAAYVEQRDKILVEAQRQLDELAARLASAVSDRQVAGTAIANGFQVDLTGLQRGNAVTVDYVDGGVTKRVTFVNASGPSATLPGNTTADPTDSVVSIDFSGPAASVEAAIKAALGPNVTVTFAAGTLSVVDDGGPPVDITGLSASITATSLTGGVELPLFVDAGNASAPYTGSLEAGAQKTGFAQRIAVNPALIADRSKLVVFSATTPAGDSQRPQYVLDRLTKTNFMFAPETGIGGGSAPYVGNIGDFARRIVERQGSNAEVAKRLDEGQKIVLNAVEARFAETAGVNVDQEMSQLIVLQTAYSANARVMTAVKDMMDLLLRM
ncbi:flagellar hook-associated protein FlgK [Chelatococcus sp. SYSU_G07232]|uniref:Flagellar hook-associated protein 1 n=1 Tax=Chelatococcus albus TaxID=3047466 RepID=A0ABT7AI56_9HYPH|nr:flagellar hook-associated protein FlgK [Chelatococcus sp. SYSU_G07232]MDJ1158469.1 flagellar hook-associated protein FlgK [Chelatococcus sp. SYSU_G07232]